MSRRWTRIAVEVGVPIALLCAWWLVSRSSTNLFFPPLSGILQRFQEVWLFDRFVSDAVPSLRNLFAGYFAGVAVGLVIGVACAYVNAVRLVLEPVVHFARAIPPVALVPILIAIMGFDAEMKITSIAVGAVFPTLIATVDGLRAEDGVRREVARVYQLPTRVRLLRVSLPAAMPHIFGGLQVSLQVAFVVMIASEMLGSTEGIGAQTILAQQTFMITDMWAGMLLLGVLGYLLNLLFDAIQRRAMAWYFASRERARQS